MMNGLGRLRILASRPLLQSWESCGSESRRCVALAKTLNAKKPKVPTARPSTTASPHFFDDAQQFGRKSNQLRVQEVRRPRVLDSEPKKPKVSPTRAATKAPLHPPRLLDDVQNGRRKAHQNKLLMRQLRVIDSAPNDAAWAQQFLRSNPTSNERERTQILSDLLSACGSLEGALRLAAVCEASPEIKSSMASSFGGKPDLSTQLRHSLAGMEVCLMSGKELLILLRLAIAVQPLPTALDCKAVRHLLAAARDRESEGFGSESRRYGVVKEHNAKNKKYGVPASRAATRGKPRLFDRSQQLARKCDQLRIQEVLLLGVLDSEPNYANWAQQFLRSNPTSKERERTQILRALLSACGSVEGALRLAAVCESSPEMASSLEGKPNLSSQLRHSLSGMEVSQMSVKELLILLRLAINVQPLDTALSCKAVRHLLAAARDPEKDRSLSEGELTTMIWLWRSLHETSKLQSDEVLAKEGLDVSTQQQLCRDLWRDTKRWECFSSRTKYQILHAGSWRGTNVEKTPDRSVLTTDPLDTAPYLNYLYDSLPSGGETEIINACKLLFSLDLPRLDTKQKSELVQTLRSWLLKVPSDTSIRTVARVITILLVLGVQVPSKYFKRTEVYSFSR